MTEPIFDHENRQGKPQLKRIVSMLTRLIQRTDRVGDAAIECEYEYEYRDAEYEYEYRDAEYECECEYEYRDAECEYESRVRPSNAVNRSGEVGRI